MMRGVQTTVTPLPPRSCIGCASSSLTAHVSLRRFMPHLQFHSCVSVCVFETGSTPVVISASIPRCSVWQATHVFRWSITLR
jgi:hypothetical protein